MVENENISRIGYRQKTYQEFHVGIMLVVDRRCSEQVKRLELGSSFISFKVSRWAKDYTLYLNCEKQNLRILFYFQISRSNPFLSLKDAK
jgi:hypothetical protein